MGIDLTPHWERISSWAVVKEEGGIDAKRPLVPQADALTSKRQHWEVGLMVPSRLVHTMLVNKFERTSMQMETSIDKS